jgi:hypothetical protein
VGAFSQPLVDTSTFQVAELRGSPHWLTSSQSSQLWIDRQRTESPNPRESACYNVPRCVSRNAKTLGLQHFAPSSGPPDRAGVVHHRADELLVERQTVLNGKPTTHVKVGAKHTQSLSRLSLYLVDVRRPGQPCNKGDPKVPCCFDPLYWSSEQNWNSLGLWTHLVILAKSSAVLFETLIAVLQSRSQSSSLLREVSAYLFTMWIVWNR